MSPLEQAIEALYTVFGKYSTSNMEHCDCGCIPEENVKKLASKPLRNLEYEHLTYYHGSALYTWGDLEHYKHFLPRVLELYYMHHASAEVDLEDVYVKLEYAGWNQWPHEERKAIKNFVKEDWLHQIGHNDVPMDRFEWESFGAFFDFEELLNLWVVNDRSNGLRSFVYYFYYQGNAILNVKPESERERRKQVFLQFIKSNNLVASLEDEFFKKETTDSEYAELVSIVQQMIELELKVNSAF